MNENVSHIKEKICFFKNTNYEPVRVDAIECIGCNIGKIFNCINYQG